METLRTSWRTKATARTTSLMLLGERGSFPHSELGLIVAVSDMKCAFMACRYDVVFVFELLWRTRKAFGFPKIWLPETIVFRNNHPTGWYFTHPLDGRIMKRNLGQEHFITQKKVISTCTST